MSLVADCSEEVLKALRKEHPSQTFFAKNASTAYTWRHEIYRKRNGLLSLFPQKIAEINYSGWESGYSHGCNSYDTNILTKEKLESLVVPVLDRYFHKVQFPQSVPDLR